MGWAVTQIYLQALFESQKSRQTYPKTELKLYKLKIDRLNDVSRRNLYAHILTRIDLIGPI